MKNKTMRVYYLLLSVLLLGVEIYIGACTHGWVRTSLGDILVIPLIYCLVRIFLPQRSIMAWHFSSERGLMRISTL